MYRSALGPLTAPYATPRARLPGKKQVRCSSLGSNTVECWMRPTYNKPPTLVAISLVIISSMLFSHMALYVSSYEQKSNLYVTKCMLCYYMALHMSSYMRRSNP